MDKGTWNIGKSGWIVYSLLATGLAILVYNNLVLTQAEQHFAFLAHAFLQGHLNFVDVPGTWADTAYYEGKFYWPLGPLPAVLMLPSAALFGPSAQQGHLLFFVNISIVFLLYRIAKQFTTNHASAVWLSFAYVFSTAYLFVAIKPWSWYFAQALATLFLLLAIVEFLQKRRAPLIGVYLALGIAVRINLLFAALFFAASFLLEPGQFREKSRKLIFLCAPIGLSLALLLLYNYCRFGDPLEFGYRYQLLINEQAVNREQGLWGLIHFPSNIYHFLFKSPDPVFLPGSKILTYPFVIADVWGMSVLFTSPILLWALRANFRDRTVYLSFATAAVMLFVVLGYYGIGVRQFGYRYALDAYPFLFVMLAAAFKERLTLPARAMITVSFLLNSYFIFS